MADEKKPKIDLKARLGKNAGGGATPPPVGVGGALPTPASGPTNLGGSTAAAVPAPTPTTPKAVGLPVPPGIPVGPPPAFKSSGLSLDPSNPLAAAVAPAASPARPIEPPKPQRIEVDELTVQEARKGARRQGLIAGIVVAFVTAAIGYIAGGAQETNKGRAQSVAHAKSLAEDVNKSREQLKTLAEKIEAGRTMLGQKKFPDGLVRDLGGINVDFDGSKLAGVRFSGFSADTTRDLIEYISGVQATNDRKNALQSLLVRLQKPMAEQFKQQESGKPPPVNFVVLINRDSAKNPYGILAPLQKPIELSANMPAEYTAVDPMTKSNVVASKFATLDKPGAAYVVQKSVEAACPSETSGQIGQLVSQLSRMITDIRGEATVQGEAEIREPKPGLLERADRVFTNLNKVQ
jgi:hypothetical protein